MKSRFWAALSLIALAAAARLLPHPANATPILAMALFSGAAFGGFKGRLDNSKIAGSKIGWAIFSPLVAMLISDLALGLHDQMISVYGSLMLISIVGLSLGEKRGALRVGAASITASVLFFVVTNFSVWLSGSMYAPTGAGLAECFMMALPFFRNELMGTLVSSGLMFGAWAFITGNAKSETVARLGELKAKGSI